MFNLFVIVAVVLSQREVTEGGQMYCLNGCGTLLGGNLGLVKPNGTECQRRGKTVSSALKFFSTPYSKMAAI